MREKASTCGRDAQAVAGDLFIPIPNESISDHMKFEQRRVRAVHCAGELHEPSVFLPVFTIQVWQRS